MRYSDWEPIYGQIAKEFGFSAEKDDASASILDSLVEGKKLLDEARLGSIIGTEATVCGDGPNLDEDLQTFSPRGTLLVADGATGRLMARRIWPDIIVTDLDGDVEPQHLANESGAVMVVLAHGDNLERIKEVVPRLLGPIVPTTQVRPHGHLSNFGGFTDGDRAVELARHFGARKVNLLGFDFRNPNPVGGKDLERKRRKLAWARKLIYDLNPPGVVLWSP
ncbi:MAG: DUF115 domain-containing protein [Methanomassiliicoccales archaeon]|nr:DUF115 domain-containing protein [Methanomassiliicoccales archaeon]